MTRRYLFFLLPLVLGTLLCATSQAREFRLGIISDKPVQAKLPDYAPVAVYVAERLKPMGITAGKVVVTENLDKMLRKIRNREVDVVFESAFSTLKMSSMAGMKPRLLVWKRGVRDYRTVFVVRKGSTFRGLRDLKGKSVALQDPDSTSGFLIPTAELKRTGLKIVGPSTNPPSGAVRYVLVAHEKNQAFWVLQKRVDAAAFSSDDWNDLPPRVRNDLKVIHTSSPVLRYVASFHPDLPAELGDAIAQTLAQMDRDPQGKRILAEASRTSKIEPLSPRDFESLDYVRRLMQAQ